MEKDLDFAMSAEDVYHFAREKSLLIRRYPSGTPVWLSYAGGWLSCATYLETGREVKGLRHVDGIPKKIGCTDEMTLCGALVLPWSECFRLSEEARSGESAPAINRKQAAQKLIVWDCGGISRLPGIAGKYRRLREWGFHTADCVNAVPGIEVRQVQRLQSVLHYYSGSYPANVLVFDCGKERIALRCAPAPAAQGDAPACRARHRERKDRLRAFVG